MDVKKESEKLDAEMLENLELLLNMDVLESEEEMDLFNSLADEETSDEPS